MSTQQQANAGDYCCIIQVVGDHNTFGTPPHLKIYCPSRQRIKVAEPAKDEAFLLRPVVEATDFVGRPDLIEDFVCWANTHDPMRPVSVRVVHGGAGVGKTRFARELCRALGPDWQAGFVDGLEARRFLAQNNLSNWGWQKPTLVVFDYVLSIVDMLPQWMRELCAAPPQSHPLRILLLERQADNQGGWLDQIFRSGFGEHTMVPRDLLDGLPVLLSGFSLPLIQQEILQNMLDRLGSHIVLPPDDVEFKARLAATDWAGAPLYLMMAAMVMHQQGQVSEVLHLRRIDLAQAVAEHEYERVKRACRGNRAQEILLAHMAAYVTLSGGLVAEVMRKCLAEEKVALGCESVDTIVALEVLEDVLSDGGSGVAPVQPDIVGEAFLLRHLGVNRFRQGGEAVVRAFGYNPAQVAAVLVRCVQDFVPTNRVVLSGRETDAQGRALGWLQMVGGMPELPLPLLFILIDALPGQTEALRALALDWQLQCVERLRFAPSTVENRSKLAVGLNNLAIRCRQMGHLGNGISAARESVSISRKQISTEKNIFIKELALSLTTLANCLSHAGQQEDALESAQEAVSIRRELFKAEPDVFRQDLASSLNTMAIVFGLLKRPKEALPIACEATEIFRELATADPANFRCKLADSLTSLSNRFSEAGQLDNAIAVVNEAVTIYREMVAVHPDAYRPALAMNLNNLAHKLSRKGKIGDALRFVREAISISRELAIAHPNAFQPDLARNLNNLGAWLGKSGEREEALTAVHEAVAIRRGLVATNPTSFLPDLAMSLSTMVLLLIGDTSQREKALSVAREAASIYRVLVRQHPNIFEDNFQLAMASWLAVRRGIALDEAAALLSQDYTLHSHALVAELDSDSSFST